MCGQQGNRVHRGDLRLTSHKDAGRDTDGILGRHRRRIDVVLLIGGIVYVVEYKIGAEVHERYAIDQVTDYALDLKNFHEASHCKYVVPILVSTKAKRQFGRINW